MEEVLKQLEATIDSLRELKNSKVFNDIALIDPLYGIYINNLSLDIVVL